MLLEIRGNEIFFDHECVAVLKKDLAATLITKLDDYIMSMDDPDEYKRGYNEGVEDGYGKGYDDGWTGKEYNSGLDENRTTNNKESTE
jgi:hypothetical protein